jgi:hypothetical protein
MVNCPKPGCSLSVSFSEVNPTTYSWKFRNDGTQSVYIQFKYTYVDADSKQLTTQPDMFPKALGPGEVWGGWATYTAHTRWNGYTGGPPVTINITSVRLGDQSAMQVPAWTDPATGLMWALKEDGANVTWQQAANYCQNLTLGDLSGWRLPTVDELQGIYDPGANVNGHYHVKGNLQISEGQWSNSQGSVSGQAWVFAFADGERISVQLGLSNTLHALCVRSSGR